MMAIYFWVSKYLCQISGGTGTSDFSTGGGFFDRLAALRNFGAPKIYCKSAVLCVGNSVNFDPIFFRRENLVEKTLQKWENSCNHNMKFQIYSAKSVRKFLLKHPNTDPWNIQGRSNFPIGFRFSSELVW